MSDDKKEMAIKKSAGERKNELQRYSSTFEEMERMFDDIFQRRFFAPSWLPRFKFPEFADVATSVDLTRQDGDEFLQLAPQIPVSIKVEVFPLENANEALAALRTGRIRAAGVLVP